MGVFTCLGSLLHRENGAYQCNALLGEQGPTEVSRNSRSRLALGSFFF